MSSASGFSMVGKVKYSAWAGLFLVNIIVLALSARVNNFQEFFFVADLFPLAMSIITLVSFVFLIGLDLSVSNSFTARPTFDLAFLFLFSIFWMAFNAFSTARWSQVPLACASIPAQYADEKTWCVDLQALKAFVWIEWVGFFLTAVFTLRYALSQNSAGHKHIWSTPLSRYSPYAYPSSESNDIYNHGAFNGGSEFVGGSEFRAYNKMAY